MRKLRCVPLVEPMPGITLSAKMTMLFRGENPLPAIDTFLPASVLRGVTEVSTTCPSDAEDLDDAVHAHVVEGERRELLLAGVAVAADVAQLKVADERVLGVEEDDDEAIAVDRADRQLVAG